MKAADKARRRERLARAQGGICPWCNLPLPEDLAGTAVDHIIPSCRGGPHEKWNLRLLHSRCNGPAGKGNQLTAEAEELAVRYGIVLREPLPTSWPGSNKAGSSGNVNPYRQPQARL